MGLIGMPFLCSCNHTHNLQTFSLWDIGFWLLNNFAFTQARICISCFDRSMQFCLYSYVLHQVCILAPRPSMTFWILLGKDSNKFIINASDKLLKKFLLLWLKHPEHSWYSPSFPIIFVEEQPIHFPWHSGLRQSSAFLFDTVKD